MDTSWFPDCEYCPEHEHFVFEEGPCQLPETDVISEPYDQSSR